MSQKNAFLTGQLHTVFPIDNSNPKYSKQLFWLKEPDTERYPNIWELQLTGEDMKRIKQVGIGDTIECEVQVRGRKFIKKDRSEAVFTYNHCVGIRIVEKLQVTSNYKPGAHDKDVAQNQSGRLGFE